MSRKEGGYSLVALVVAVTILNILLAVSLPVWSKAIQREKEEALIFRGLQYAEAIRVFKLRHGRAPVRLEELVEVKPRSIRRLWEDPMTADGSWALIFETGPQAPRPGQAGQGGGQAGQQPNGRPANQPQGQVTLQPQPGSGPGGGAGGRQVTVGPIAGVRSKSTDPSIKVLFGAQQYDQWLFTAAAVTPGAQQAGQGAAPVQGSGPGGPNRRRPRQPTAAQLGNPQQQGQQSGTLTPLKWIGRPFRDGIQPPQNGLPGQGGFANDNMPGGLEPGLQPPPPGAPGEGSSGVRDLTRGPEPDDG